MAKLIQSTKYQSADGKKFDSAIEADGHDYLKGIEGRLNAFIKDAGIEGAQATLAKKNVANFLAWDEVTDPTYVIEPVKAEVAAEVAAEGTAEVQEESAEA